MKKLFIILMLTSTISAADSFAFTPLDDLATGFRVYCGPDTDITGWSLTADLIGNRPANIETTFLVTETTIPQGQNVCAMKSYNSIGESPYTNTASFERVNDEVTSGVPLAPQGFGLIP